MIDILCKCGEHASLTYSNDMYGIDCKSCGRQAGPENCFDTIYRKWHELVPIRKSADSVCSSIKRIIMEVSDRGSWVPAEDLIKISDDTDSGRRALHILADTGLLRTKYIVGGDEVSFDDAINLRGSGKLVSVFFIKSFSRK
jgi:predicted DNA-binding ArsR family transcriptional regulator